MKSAITIIITLCFIGFLEARAGDRITYETYKSQGVALALSQAQITRDWATPRTQVGIGIGSYNDSQAFSIGIGKALKEDGPLLNFTIGKEDDEVGIGAGINWRM